MRKLGRDRLILLCVVLLPMLLWWVVFFPGTFTNDSLAIIEQIRTGNWSNDHTNAYLSFVWLTSGGGSQWGLVTLAQVILVALGITSLGSVVRRIGIPKPVVMVACGVFSMLPQVGAFAITMWKDVPSTAGALMLAAALLEHHVASSPKTPTLWLAGTGALLLGAFRWNGPIALVLLGLTILAADRVKSVRSAAVIISSALLCAGTLLLPQQLGLAESRSWRAVDDRELHDVAYVLHERPQSLNSKDKATLASIMPLERWSQGGSTCETIDVLLYDNIYEYAPASLREIERQQSDLGAIWKRVVRGQPLLVSWVRLCRAAGVWSPVFFGKQPTLGLVYLHSGDPDLGRPGFLPVLERPLIRAVMMTSSSERSKSLTLNAMLWTLVALSLSFVLKRGAMPRLFRCCLPVSIAVMVSVMAGAVAQDARYVAGPLLLAQFFSGVSILEWVWYRITVTRSRRA